MKKIFKIKQEKINSNRAIEAIKHEIRKYIKREKKKDLPNKQTMYWDFDCKYGKDEDSAKECTFNEILTELSSVLSANWSECYIEIVAKTVDKPTKEEEGV